MIREAANRVSLGEKVVFAQPTEELIHKTVNDELKKLSFDVKYEIITGDTVSSVTSELMKRFNSTDEPILLFITHKGLLDHRQQGHLGSWKLIVDEAPVVFGSEELRLPVTHKLITDHICFNDSNGYSLLSIRTNALIRAKSRNTQNDAVYYCVQNLASKLESRHWDVSSRLIDIAHSSIRKFLPSSYFTSSDPACSGASSRSPWQRPISGIL